MEKFIRLLWIYRKFLVAFLTPLLFLPLPIVVNTLEAKCGFVLIVMALYWCTECVPLAVTALLPVILFPMFGIMKSEQVCVQYFNDASMLGAGGLMVAIAVEHWKLHKRFALGMLLLVGVKPALLMMGFMSITAFLSMWITNMACTAMMLPIVHSVLEQLRKNEDEAIELDAQQMQTEQVSHITATHLGNRNNVEDELSPEDLQGAEQRRLKLKQKYANLKKGMSLSVCYAATIGGTATLTGSVSNLILKGQIDKLFPENGEVISYSSWIVFSLPNMVVMLLVSWIWLQFIYLGFNVKQNFGCRKTSRSEREAYLQIKSEYLNLGRMSFAESSVLVLFLLLVLLWFTRDPGFMTGWASLLFNQERKFVTDGTVSIFVSLLFFIVPSKIPRCSHFHGRSLDINGRRSRQAPQTLLHWTLVQKKLPWSIVLILGGAFAMAKGSEVSGFSQWLGQGLDPLQNIPPLALSFLLCLVVTLLTEFCNSTVIISVFLPILASMAINVELHPLYIMLPTTLAASFAFMLPIATACNAITFSYANLTIMDMVKPGLVLNLLGILCINLTIHTWGAVMFQLNEFPAWANITSPPYENSTIRTLHEKIEIA